MPMTAAIKLPSVPSLRNAMATRSTVALTTLLVTITSISAPAAIVPELRETTVSTEALSVTPVVNEVICVTLTLDRYSHTIVGDLAEALKVLPDLPPKPDAERLRATGTLDVSPDMDINT